MAYAIVPADDRTNVNAAGDPAANRFDTMGEAEAEIASLRACGPDFDIDWEVIELSEACAQENLWFAVFGWDGVNDVLDEADRAGWTAQDYVSESLRVAISEGLNVDLQDAYCYLCHELGIPVA